MKYLLKVALKNLLRKDERVVVIESAEDLATVSSWYHAEMIEVLVALLDEDKKEALFDTANEVYMEVGRDV